MTTSGRILRSLRGERSRTRGLWITALGIVAISPDSLIIRLISVDVWTLLAWRAPLTAIGLLGILYWRYGGRTPSMASAMGRNGIGVMLVSATSNILFVLAILHTSVANVLLIMAAAPMVTGLLAWRFLDERLALRTWIAIAMVIGGVSLLVDFSSSSTMWGDLAAVGAMLGLSISLTLLRRAHAHDGTPALAGAQTLVGLVALPLASYTTVTTSDLALLAGSGLFMLPLATALVIAGPRYLPAAEVGLLLPLETVLGTFLVWLVIGEAPSSRTLVGAAIILGTLATHSLIALRRPWLRSAHP